MCIHRSSLLQEVHEVAVARVELLFALAYSHGQGGNLFGVARALQLFAAEGSELG